MPSLQFGEGLALGLSLLVAIGPKDTFVIRNSLRGNNALLLVLICALSDVALIAFGVLGLGALVTANRWLMVLTMSGSVLYLIYFGVAALRSAKRGPDFGELSRSGVVGAQRSVVVKGALFHSLLTPLAWLDTVLVIGSISATKLGQAKFEFAGGAVAASFLWFIFLTASSRVAAPLFASKRMWQLLDIVAAASMFLLTSKLIADYPWNAA